MRELDAVQHPAGRVGSPLISLIWYYLCSDMAGFITGENICIDGGMTRQIYHRDCGWSLTLRREINAGNAHSVSVDNREIIVYYVCKGSHSRISF